MPNFSVCLIGCGAMANGGHGPALQKYARTHENIRLAGCCDIDRAKAEHFKNAFGFEKAYTDFEAMLDEIRPQAVCLISPVNATCDLAVRILEKGYPLFLEKPPGRSRAEIERIHAAAQRAGVTVFTAFNRRYTPLLLRLKEWIKEERIFNITYQMYRYNRRDADFSTTSIHALDAVRHLAGSDYADAHFTYQELPEAGKSVANIYIDARMENGAHAQLSLVPMGGVIAERATVNTDRATYFLELPFWENLDSPGHLRRMANNAVTHDISGDTLIDACVMFEDSGFYEENRRFLDHLIGGAPRMNDLPLAIQPVEMADCIRRRITTYEKALLP